MKSHKEILDEVTQEKFGTDFDTWFCNVIGDRDKLRIMTGVIDRFDVLITADTMNTCSKIFDSLEFGADEKMENEAEDEFDSFTNPKKDMGGN